MLSKKKFRLLLLFLFLACSILGVNWYYRKYQDEAFKRAYEHGNIYEQLDSLMNTTRYVDDVRKAGYKVDDWGIIWNHRIDSLNTHTTPVVEISVPQTESVGVRLAIDDNNVIRIRYDTRMNLKEVVYYKDKKILVNKEIPKDIYNKYVKLSNQAIATLLKDVYTEMYDRK